MSDISLFLLFIKLHPKIGQITLIANCLNVDYFFCWSTQCCVFRLSLLMKFCWSRDNAVMPIEQKKIQGEKQETVIQNASLFGSPLLFSIITQETAISKKIIWVNLFFSLFLTHSPTHPHSNIQQTHRTESRDTAVDVLHIIVTFCVLDI